MSGALSVAFRGVSLLLLPERAVVIQESKTLLVADLHFGKGTQFQRSGIPVSSESHASDLRRLSKTVGQHGIEEIVFLGDFFHSTRNLSPADVGLFTAWIETLDCPCTLVVGNHDRGIANSELAGRFSEIRTTIVRNELRLAHEPAPGVDLCGHLHPAARIGPRGHQLRLPCFADSGELLVVPAYGEFTGMHTVSFKDFAKLYVTTGKSVVEVDAPSKGVKHCKEKEI